MQRSRTFPFYVAAAGSLSLLVTAFVLEHRGWFVLWSLYRDDFHWPVLARPLYQNRLDFEIDWWVIEVFFAILPSIAVTRLYTAWSSFGSENPLVCRRYGYDLCATPDRCPECGTETTRT